jgi:hypothetical protein
MREISNPFDGFGSPFGAWRWKPMALFADGGNGIVWDFSTTAPMYTDSAGTTPLTTPAQTIGLVADGSRVRSPITAYAGVQASAGLRPAWGQATAGYAVFNRTDNILSTVLTLAQTGDVMVFGRTGSWLETGRVYGAGATFSVGASGGVGPAASQITGLATLNILRAVGDIVGIVAMGRASTAAEQASAMAYFRARGAAGFLAVSGAELVTNGDFASGTTGWTENAFAAISNVANRLRITALAASPAAYTTITTVIGQPYLLSAQYVTDAMTGNAFFTAGLTPTTTENLSINAASTVGTYTGAFVATATTTYVRMNGTSAALATETMDWDNVSCRLLVAS